MGSTKTYSQLSDAEILHRLLRHRRPKQVESLYRDGPMSVHWEGDLFRPSGDPKEEATRRFRAARYMVCRLAGQRFKRFAPVLADVPAVAAFLFLAYSQPDWAISGVVVLSAEGLGLGSFLFRSDRRGYSLSDKLADSRRFVGEALLKKAHSLLLFHLRPGGALDLTAEEEEMGERFRVSAQALGIEIADTWIIASPSRWRCLASDVVLPPDPPQSTRSSFLATSVAEWSAVQWHMGNLLHHGPPREFHIAPPRTPDEAGLLVDLLYPRKWDDLRELAMKSPDDVEYADLTVETNQVLAALVEWTNRLMEVEVPKRLMIGGAEWLSRLVSSKCSSLTEHLAFFLTFGDSFGDTFKVRFRRVLSAEEVVSTESLVMIATRMVLDHRVLTLVSARISDPDGVPSWSWPEGFESKMQEVLSSLGIGWQDLTVSPPKTDREPSAQEHEPTQQRKEQ